MQEHPLLSFTAKGYAGALPLSSCRDGHSRVATAGRQQQRTRINILV